MRISHTLGLGPINYQRRVSGQISVRVIDLLIYQLLLRSFDELIATGKSFACDIIDLISL